ncbi:hypothetical protein BDA96_08G014900 [Sorghum bicolor]|uniref:Uncharacterized protein n=2 Tax=Sorghum bicolor TaxID=4558 RepID=A0A1B6PB12_SORBI|nr:uncharacterized protein LOC110429924 [Sorghum bicolor]KAG0519766.1 hypothetical protein BDA96_08G014900 [Sorghum bicolor]KXG22828.1 hypothetical protein SORBI_3008G013600 [Sorghum bicolor]|eukprot:XP_021302365.1 uncharacterized protein LOC110429924 [Sorghum bicolor]
MHRCRPCCACLCPPLSPLLRSLHPHLRLSPPASQFVCCPRLVRCCLRLRQFVWSPSPVALCPPHILIQESSAKSKCWFGDGTEQIMLVENVNLIVCIILVMPSFHLLM